MIPAKKDSIPNAKRLGTPATAPMMTRSNQKPKPHPTIHLFINQSIIEMDCVLKIKSRDKQKERQTNKQTERKTDKQTD